MATKSFNSITSLDHHILRSYPGWNPGKTLEYVLDVRKGNDGRLVFEYVTKPAQNLPPPHNGKSPALDIKIHGSKWIQIELSENSAWHWHPEKAVTMGVKTDDCFQLEYKTTEGFEPGPTTEKCRVIRFGAQKAGSGDPDDAYPFNLNVMLECADGNVLPITIDPDIRNPGTVP
jgi:hypothetical protein